MKSWRCFFGIHDFAQWEMMGEFGYTLYQKRMCQECGLLKTREAGRAAYKYGFYESFTEQHFDEEPKKAAPVFTLVK